LQSVRADQVADMAAHGLVQVVAGEGGGRGVYRAHLAAREAQERARRPKRAKLAVNSELRECADPL